MSFLASNYTPKVSNSNKSLNCANCPLETHYNWQPANSIKYLKLYHQDTYNNDHTIKPQQVQAIKKGQCNNVSYKQAWQLLKATQTESLSDNKESFQRIPAFL
jgi:hypothetical protein